MYRQSEASYWILIGTSAGQTRTLKLSACCFGGVEVDKGWSNIETPGSGIAICPESWVNVSNDDPYKAVSYEAITNLQIDRQVDVDNTMEQLRNQRPVIEVSFTAVNPEYCMLLWAGLRCMASALIFPGYWNH